MGLMPIHPGAVVGRLRQVCFVGSGWSVSSHKHRESGLGSSALRFPRAAGESAPYLIERAENPRTDPSTSWAADRKHRQPMDRWWSPQDQSLLLAGG